MSLSLEEEIAEAQRRAAASRAQADADELAYRELRVQRLVERLREVAPVAPLKTR